MVPKRAFSLKGLTVTTGLASVNPYPSLNTHPVTSFHRSATDFCNAIPPATVIFNPEKSQAVKSLLFKSALNNVFKPGKSEIFSFLKALTTDWVSRALGIKTFFIPKAERDRSEERRVGKECSTVW